MLLHRPRTVKTREGTGFLWVYLQQERSEDKFIIPEGTTILEGTVVSNFGQPGGGY